MEYRHLEITLISADGIKDVNTFGKMDVYAVAFISGHPQAKKKTTVDKNSGTSPRWNERFDFAVDERVVGSSNLVIQLKAEKSFGPDKDIGEVVVPVAELFEGFKSKHGAQVEYQVRTPSGKPKGTVRFMYKFGEKSGHNYPEKNKSASSIAPADEPVTAYPAPGYNKQGQAHVPTAATQAYQQPYSGNPGYGYYPPPPNPNQGYYGAGAYPMPGGYPQHHPPGYGYGAAPPPPLYQQQPKKKKNGLGMGLGLGAGLLGGMILGDMVSDVGEMAAYNDGYEDAMEDASGFDF